MSPDPIPASDAPLPKPPARRWIWSVAQWGLFLLVLGFVGNHAWSIIDSETVDFSKLPIRWGWLLLAALSSFVGWFPCVWYWGRLLSALGYAPPLPPLSRAYFCGHPGKYVPGKGTVLVIRAAMLHRCGVPPAVTVYTVTLETLTYISAGIVVSVLLLPWLAHAAPRWREFADWIDRPAARIGVSLAAVAGSIVGLAILSFVSRRLAAKFEGSSPSMQTMSGGISIRTISAGLLVYVAAWWMQGVTLGLTLQSISAESVDWSNLPNWTAAAAVALVGGFLAMFAPAGLGVREGLVIELLEQQVGPAESVMAAMLWRALTLVADIVTAVAFYYLIRPCGSAKTEGDARDASS